MSAMQLIAATLLAVATPGMKPKALIAAVREKHPEVSKKEIARAAFYALTDTGTVNQDAAQHLQDFALGERGGGDEEAETAAERPRRKLKAKPKASKEGQKV